MAEIWRNYWYYLAILVLLYIVWRAHFFYFVTNPMRVAGRLRSTQPDRLRTYLERVIATPSLTGSGVKFAARVQLAELYFAAKRHEDAVRLFRENLKNLAMINRTNDMISLEASQRESLAESLEALGRTAEATEERDYAVQLLSQANPPTTLTYSTIGKLLQRQHKHAEAYAAYLKALNATSSQDLAIRIQCMMRLSISGFDAGMPTECRTWAEKAIETGATKSMLQSAHRMAGLAAEHLSQWKEAERHFRLGLDVSKNLNNSEATAAITAQLAGIILKIGKFEEAAALWERAAQAGGQGRQMSLGVQSHFYSLRGDYEKLVAVLQEFRRGIEFNTASANRRMLGALDLDTARAHCLRGNAFGRNRLPEPRWLS